MRLTDFDPHWINMPQAATGVKFYVGISFLCPHCAPKACPTCGHLPAHKRLAVSFWPPIDPDNWLAKMGGYPHANFHKRVSGETFDTLTIDPSIGFDSIGHWHGRITNGEITP